MVFSRPRYARCAKPSSGDGEGAVCVTGHRHGHRSRSLLGSFGQVEIEMPRRIGSDQWDLVLRMPGSMHLIQVLCTRSSDLRSERAIGPNRACRRSKLEKDRHDDGQADQYHGPEEQFRWRSSHDWESLGSIITLTRER
jgi:hypothetical protein